MLTSFPLSLGATAAVSSRIFPTTSVSIFPLTGPAAPISLPFSLSALPPGSGPLSRVRRGGVSLTHSSPFTICCMAQIIPFSLCPMARRTLFVFFMFFIPSNRKQLRSGAAPPCRLTTMLGYASSSSAFTIPFTPWGPGGHAPWRWFCPPRSSIATSARPIVFGRSVTVLAMLPASSLLPRSWEEC